MYSDNEKDRGQFMYEKAMYFNELESYRESLKILHELLENDVGNPQITEELANIYLYSYKDNEKAATVLNDCIEKASDGT